MFYHYYIFGLQRRAVCCSWAQTKCCSPQHTILLYLFWEWGGSIELHVQVHKSGSSGYHACSNHHVNMYLTVLWTVHPRSQPPTQVSKVNIKAPLHLWNCSFSTQCYMLICWLFNHIWPNYESYLYNSKRIWNLADILLTNCSHLTQCHLSYQH